MFIFTGLIKKSCDRKWILFSESNNSKKKDINKRNKRVLVSAHSSKVRIIFEKKRIGYKKGKR